MPRVLETDCTTLGPVHAEAYDLMQATLQQMGWLETKDLLQSGVVRGFALEVGSGPGYLGLDWLQRTSGTRLIGIDRSLEMVVIARRHVRELGLDDRAMHLLGRAETEPFEEGSFDSVFSSRSLHEWTDPGLILTEVWRVLKPGGRLFVSDLRRDLARAARNFLEQRMTSAVVLEGLRASIGAAFTVGEVAALLDKIEIFGCEVVETPLGLRVTGVKPR